MTLLKITVLGLLIILAVVYISDLYFSRTKQIEVVQQSTDDDIEKFTIDKRYNEARSLSEKITIGDLLIRRSDEKPRVYKLKYIIDDVNYVLYSDDIIVTCTLRELCNFAFIKIDNIPNVCNDTVLMKDDKMYKYVEDESDWILDPMSMIAKKNFLFRRNDGRDTFILNTDIPDNYTVIC